MSSSGVDSGSALRVCSEVCGFLFLDCTARCVYSGHLSVWRVDIPTSVSTAAQSCTSCGGRKIRLKRLLIGKLKCFCFIFLPSDHLSHLIPGCISAWQMEHILIPLDLCHKSIWETPQRKCLKMELARLWGYLAILAVRLRSDSVSFPAVSHS